tara:strand:+ start:7548 stop:8585 length:1038 start_codon:yes stop_codon:yes gene_type:complete
LKSVNIEKSRDFFAELGINNDGITSIIEFGTTRAPELSDVDIMIVIKSNDVISSVPKWVQFRSYPKDIKAALDGGAVKIVTEKQFFSLPILGAMNINTIFGQPINQISFDENLKRMIAITDVMDWLAERVITLQAHIDSNGIHPSRAINCTYSITHTFNRAVIAGAISEQVASEYKEEVDQFRCVWQKAPSKVNVNLVPWLKERLDDAITLSIKFSCFMQTKSYYFAPNDAEQNSFQYNNGLLNFSNNLNTIVNVSQQSNNRALPGVWLAHIGFQSRLNGTIPDEIRTRIHGGDFHKEFQLTPKLEKLITRRMDLCNSIADMLLPLGMQDNIYRFGHLLTHPKPS